MRRTIPKEVEDAYVSRVVPAGASIAIQDWEEVAEEEFSLPSWRAYRFIHRAGFRVDRSRRNAVDETALHPPFSDEARYWIGYLMADGCVVEGSGGRQPCLSFSQSFKKGRNEAVHRFRDFLDSKHAITLTVNKYGHRSEVFQVRSSRIAAALAVCGVSPRKSNREEASPDMARSRHFWLGYFDGDGCLKMSRKQEAIEVVGSRRILEQLVAFAGRTASIRLHHGTHQVVFYSQHARALARKVYEGSGIWSLPSKREMVEAWFLAEKTKRPRRWKAGPRG